MGLAAHLGLFLDLPAIGCAKNRLIGTFEIPGEEKGNKSDLFYKNEKIGAVVRTRTGVKPLFISPGYKIMLNEAVGWILKTCTKFRIPEPIRMSHHAANQLRLKSENNN